MALGMCGSRALQIPELSNNPDNGEEERWKEDLSTKE